jgi:CheY-like chemotaxis protein
MNTSLNCHVLVVDDSPILRAAIKKVVKLAGVPEDRIFEAGNGVEAREMGFVTRVVDDPRAAALETAREIASKSPDAMRANKRLLNAAVAMKASSDLSARKT